MLLGPGRWGTSSPELGIPVHFAEISRVSVLCEIVTMRENLIPDVSLGTHFLNELVEMNILYMALFPQQQPNYLNESFFLTPRTGSWICCRRKRDGRNGARDRHARRSLGRARRAADGRRQPTAGAESSLPTRFSPPWPNRGTTDGGRVKDRPVNGYPGGECWAGMSSAGGKLRYQVK